MRLRRVAALRAGYIGRTLIYGCWRRGLELLRIDPRSELDGRSQRRGPGWLLDRTVSMAIMAKVYEVIQLLDAKQIASDAWA